MNLCYKTTEPERDVVYCAELHVLLAAVSSSLGVQLGFRHLLLCLPSTLPSMPAAIPASLYPVHATTFSPASPALQLSFLLLKGLHLRDRLRVNKLTL